MLKINNDIMPIANLLDAFDKNDIKPYTCVKLQWLCQQLHATMPDIENLVANLILDNCTKGRLNQNHLLLDLNFGRPGLDEICNSLSTAALISWFLNWLNDSRLPLVLR